MQPQFFQNKMNKKIIIAIVAFVISVIGIFAIILVIIDSRKTATLEILVAPTSAQIIIDGKFYKNGTYSFEPGEYQATISQTDFVTQEITLTLKAQETTKLSTYLKQSDGTYSWYLSHNDDALILNTIGDEQAAQKAASFLEKYPISNILPIIYAKYSDDYSTYTEFRIDGGAYDDCKTDFCLQITDQTGNSLQTALDLITDKGYNPDDYEILYVYDPIISL